MSKMSERERQWHEFSDAVATHLREYTVPQYGDHPNDVIAGYSIEDCVANMKRYVTRYGQQSRDGQQELDFMKIAHYAQCAWEKYRAKESEKEPFAEGVELFFSYSVMEDNNLAEKGFEFVGVGADKEGCEVHIWKKKETGNGNSNQATGKE